MRLLIDEDSIGRVFVRLVEEAGHDIETVTTAGLTGRPDADVFVYAQQTGRILLTRNGKDFLLLHQADSNHAGIIVEYQDADSSKNMSSMQIVAALGNIEASGWSLSGKFISINAWR